jgi:hypothetical protein
LTLGITGPNVAGLTPIVPGCDAALGSSITFVEGRRMRVVRNLSRFATIAAVAAIPAVGGAQPMIFGGVVSPANQPSVVGAPTGSGLTQVTIDPTAHTLRVYVAFAGLTGPNTASHIHCCTADPFPLNLLQTAGVATATPTFPGFPAGVAGVYDQTFNTLLASTYRAGFVAANGGTAAGAEAALFGGIQSGRAYLNIHTALNPGGEMRAFLTAVPEPSTYALMATGLGVVGMMGWRRRRSV